MGSKNQVRDAKQALEIAKSLKVKSKLDEALNRCKEILELDSENVQAWQQLAHIHETRTELDEAIRCSQKAIDLEPQNAQLYIQLAKSLKQQGKNNEVIETYQKAIDLNPQQPAWVYQNLGDLLSQKEKFKEAIAAYEQAIILKPDDSNLYRFLGSYQFRNGEIEAAIASYQKAIDLNPQQPAWVYINLGNALKDKSQLEGAIECYQKAIKLEPEQPAWFYTYLGEVLSNCDRTTEAIECYQKILELKATTEMPKFAIEQGCWLTPSILYFEGELQNGGFTGDAKLWLRSKSGDASEIASARFFQLIHKKFAAVAIFSQPVQIDIYGSYALTAFSNGTSVLIDGNIAQQFYSLQFINFLNNKSDFQKHLIRENLSQTVIDFVTSSLQHEAQGLLYKLQHFVTTSPRTFHSPDFPFKIGIDRVIPIESEGVFLSGWMHDPDEILEEIEAISDLGFIIPFKDKIYPFEQKDQNENFKKTTYGKLDKPFGFCAYVRVDRKTRQTFEKLAELHGFRFNVKLKGGIEAILDPQVKYYDIYTARKLVLQVPDRAVPGAISDEILEKCMKPAASKLQQLCMEKVEVQDVAAFGQPVEDPLISIIIPLYKQLDFLKVQFATMANDPAMRQCEIIYVLDSPEQKKAVHNLLFTYSQLYQLPVMLVVMERNCGYAAANNTGVKYARGSYLILMNSDVFPKTEGWAVKMADFYAASPQIGTLAPKLLYEDRSLQHAGMLFAKTKFPFWQNLHYYKGFPSTYKPAQISRAVPAVTGACLMIKRELYQEVGGLSTDYIIGDFEDSDLCLKCTDRGYESWYFAEAELYHLERQSVPLNNVYSDSLVWDYNARLHTRKWFNLIQDIMQQHPSV